MKWKTALLGLTIGAAATVVGSSAFAADLKCGALQRQARDGRADPLGGIV